MTDALKRLFGTEEAPVKSSPVPSPASANRDERQARAELMEEAEEPEYYRAAITRPRPLLGFAVIEKDGTAHGFAYFTLRHPKHEVISGREFLSFTADGMAVVVEGRGLSFIFRALIRHTLHELREYDGKPENDRSVWIDLVTVADPREERPAKATAP